MLDAQHPRFLFLLNFISWISVDFDASHFDRIQNGFNFIIASIRTNDPNQFKFSHFLFFFCFHLWLLHTIFTLHLIHINFDSDPSYISVIKHECFFSSFSLKCLILISLNFMIQLKCIFETDAAATISRSVFSSNRFLIGIRYGMQLNIVSFFLFSIAGRV